MTLSHLPGPVINPAPGYAQLHANSSYTMINLRLRHNFYRDTAPVPFLSFIYRDNFPAVYQTCTATTPERNKICTMTAKSTPYPPCTGTVFRLKYQDSCRMLRRVTQPPHIAGPLLATSGIQYDITVRSKIKRNKYLARDQFM